MDRSARLLLRLINVEVSAIFSDKLHCRYIFTHTLSTGSDYQWEIQVPRTETESHYELLRGALVPSFLSVSHKHHLTCTRYCFMSPLVQMKLQTEKYIPRVYNNVNRTWETKAIPSQVWIHRLPDVPM